MTSSSNDTDRDALANLIDKKLNGDAGYGVGAFLADAILTEFLPAHDERVRAEKKAELIELRKRVQELEVEKTKIPILKEALKRAEAGRMSLEQKLVFVQSERDEAAALSHTYRNALESERKGQGRWPDTASTASLREGSYGPCTAYGLAKMWSGWARMSPEEQSDWLSRHPYKAFEHAFVELKLSALDALSWSSQHPEWGAEL